MADGQRGDRPDAGSDAPTAAMSAPGTKLDARTGPGRRLANAVTGAVTGTRPPTAGSVATGAARGPAGERPARAMSDPSAARRAPRRARLSLRRIDPWSVLKVAFLLSLAMLVVMIVAVAVLYLVLDTLGVFSSIDSALLQVSSATNPTSVTDVFSLPKVIGGTALIGAVNVLLSTALATLGAYLYNLCASIAGGIEVTLTD